MHAVSNVSVAIILKNPKIRNRDPGIAFWAIIRQNFGIEIIRFAFFSAPMAGDRFKSPIVTAMARRQLAFDGQTVTQVVSPIKAGQSILTSPQKPVVQSPTSK